MEAQGTITLNSLIFADQNPSNNPQLQIFNYNQQWNISDIETPGNQIYNIPPGVFVTLQFPTATVSYNWVQIYTNQNIDVVTSSSSSGLIPPTPPSPPWNANSAIGKWVQPYTIGGNPPDGIYFTHGITTGIAIGNPGVTAVEVLVFLGT